MKPLHKSRNQVIFIVLLTLIIPIGLFTRSSGEMLPSFIATYAGDVLWATMIYFILCILFPQWNPVKIAIYALAVCFAVELSQLYQADWINTIRHTRLGALALGRGFLASDLICYTVGVLIPFLCEKGKRGKEKGERCGFLANGEFYTSPVKAVA